MNERISSEDFVAVMQESFERGQKLIFTPSGNSMLPMLNGRDDKVTFSPKPARLRKYDVAFYRRPKTGQLVLHRMIGFTPDGEYIFCGDNQYDYEFGIRDEDVLALMTAFTHNGVERQVTDPRYRFYVRRMMFFKRLRKRLSKIYHQLIKRD